MIELQALVEVFQVFGYEAVFLILLACGFGLPIPEDVTLVAAGVISGLGYTDVHTMVFVAMAGVLLGDGVMFTLGHIFGRRILKVHLVRKIITPERYAQVQAKFEKYGPWVVFMGRFMPGLRSPIFIVTGVSRKVSYLKFFAIDGLAALISVPLWIYIGKFGANNLDVLLKTVKKFQVGAVSGAVFIAATLIVIYYFRHKRHIRGLRKEQHNEKHDKHKMSDSAHIHSENSPEPLNPL